MKYIDLSHTLRETIPTYPHDPPVKLPQVKTTEDDGYNAYLLTTGLHTGTHIDVPLHFIDSGLTVDNYEVSNFIGEAVMLDVRGDELIEFVVRYDDVISTDSIVVLYTGFDEFYDSDKYFKSHPTLSNIFTDFLIRKNIKMLGMDIPSPDRFPFDIHKKLLGNEIILLENLTNLKSLTPYKKFKLCAVPLSIEAEASPVRAYAAV